MKRRLGPEKMAELALAAPANARRLLHDARQLREAGGVASAFVLAGLAADELGKHVLVTSFYAARQESNEEWAESWRRFRNHQEKLGDFLWSAWASDLVTEDPQPNTQRFHQRRLTATYVDLGPSDEVTIPEQEIADEEFGRVVALIEQELAYCERMTRGASPDALAETFVTVRSSELGEQLRGLGESAVGALAFAIPARTGVPPEEALRLANAIEKLLGKTDRGST